MDEFLDELMQWIEERVVQLSKELETRNQEPSQENKAKETAETAKRVNEIIMGLPEEDGRLLYDVLLDHQTISDEERMWFYKSGLADALDILRYLRR